MYFFSIIFSILNSSIAFTNEEKIFSEYYHVQKDDNIEKIIKKKIFFETLKGEEKKKVVSEIKKWNPQILNWKKLSFGTKLYLEFPRKWSREFPLIVIPTIKLAKKRSLKKDQKKEKIQRLPSSESTKKSYVSKIVYQKNPYKFDLALGSKLFYYEDAVTSSGSMIATTNLVFNFDFLFKYPANEKLNFFFGLGASYYQEQECENTKPAAGKSIEGFCGEIVTYKFPISYTLHAGLKRSLFASSLKQGFSGTLAIEREELSFLSASKKSIETEIRTEDGAKLLKATKSLFLWLTMGLDYNFSIWNKSSTLSVLGSYCLAGESNLQSSTGYWERLEPCFKVKGEYKQYLGKNLWFNTYFKLLNAKGKFNFSSIHNGLNLGYTF